MQSIGNIPHDRLKFIPKKYWAHHEFCFHLHDLMARQLVEKESRKAGHVSFKIEEGEKAILDSGVNVLDFLAQSGRGDIERRVVVNHLTNALYADLLHFVYEGLRAFEKRKFTVAYALLRKPFKESLLIAAQICADESSFLEKLRGDAKNLLNKQELTPDKTVELLDAAIKICGAEDYLQGDVIYENVFNRASANGLSGLFDKATHLVTENKKIQTEDYNVNFIFKSPSDDDFYEDNTYMIVAHVLLFLNVMQIELYDRMGALSRNYKRWVLFTSLGSFAALFGSGRSKLTALTNKMFREFMKCPDCGGSITLKKASAARLFVGETLDCAECFSSHHFPLEWLLAQVETDFSL